MSTETKTSIPDYRGLASVLSLTIRRNFDGIPRIANIAAKVTRLGGFVLTHLKVLL
jgi:hypothetical protein